MTEEEKKKAEEDAAAAAAAQKAEEDSKTPSTPDDSQEVKDAKAKIEDLEKQILQAGHVIEGLKKDKKPLDPPPALDDEVLEQKIKDGIEKALLDRLPDNRVAEAEEKAKKLLAERDELLATIRSKGNRSGGSGDAGQRPPVKPDLTLTPAEQRFTQPPYSLTPEEIIKNR